MSKEKPLGRKNYGSIPHLSNSKLGEKDYRIEGGQESILTKIKRDKHDEILVFEKYDGSNIGVCKKEGKIFALTRAGWAASTSPYSQHHIFSDWVKDREGYFHKILNEGERVAGEWMIQAHGLRYEIKEDPILFFDYFSADNKRQTFDSLVDLGLQAPRLLHRGDSILVDDLKEKLNLKSELIKSIDDPEGMVYRVERKGKVDFLAKWVRGDFKTGQYCIGVDEEDLIWNK